MSDAQVLEIKKNETPLYLMKILAGEMPGVEKEAGMILTEANILSIKRYVKKGLSLPYSLDAVIGQLGMPEIGVEGLEPKDILSLFQEIRENTLQWNDLERDIKVQAIRLDIYAKKITDTGGAILRIIDGMPIIEQVMQTVGASEIGSGINISYTDRDHKIAKGLSEVLKLMKGDVEEEKKLTDNLKLRIHNFHSTIHNELEPGVQRKRNIMKNNNLDEDIKELEENIDKLTTRIDQLIKDYDKYTGLAFTGVAGGIVGLIVTGSIYGSRAEKTRKLKNEAIAEKNGLVEQLKHKKKLRQTIEILSTQFADVQGHLKDAEAAVSNLSFVWETISQSIDESMNSFSKVEDSQSLLVFSTTFSNIINPWKNVKDYSSRLASLLEKALLTYNAIVMAENA